MNIEERRTVPTQGVIKGGLGNFFVSLPFFMLVIIIALLLGTGLGISGGLFGTEVLAAITGAIAMPIIIILRQDELTATLIVAIHLYIDWFVGLAFVAQILTLGLLLVFFLTQSPRYPWVEPRALWLWAVLLTLAIFPSLRGINALDGTYYYFNVIFNAFIILWLGTVIARDITNVRRLFIMLTIFGVILAIITLIQTTTGKLLFTTSKNDAWLVFVSGYRLGATGVTRAGSYLVNPDANGAIFALLLLPPVSLLVRSSSFLEKIFYFAAILLMSIALLATYSTGAWSAAAAGIVVFIALAGRARYGVRISVFVLVTILALIIFFPQQISFQIQHALLPAEASLRIGAWQTGIRVILAFPLTGIGMGRYVYFRRADPYRVPAQYIPLDHPHNSYLELAALGGLPIATVFIALLLFALWLALQNWVKVDTDARTLLASGLASITALSVFSMTNAGWTLTPLATICWLILGAISSPLLAKKISKKKKRM